MTHDAATPPDNSVDILVCGALWVDYRLELDAPVRHGQLSNIQSETQEASGDLWAEARTLAQNGFSVALWSNVLGEDPNGRTFKRELEQMPNLHLLQPFSPEIETWYRVRLQVFGMPSADLWRHADQVHLPPFVGQEISFRAVVVRLFENFEPVPDVPTLVVHPHIDVDVLEWARDVLR